MALLTAKLLLAPGCVLAVSMAARTWGMAVAGIIGGLPVVAGPILLVMSLTHGQDFGARAATGTLLGLIALTVFVVVYGRIAQNERGPAAAVFAGWLAFLVSVALLTLIEPRPIVALVLVGGAFAIGLAALTATPGAASAERGFPWWDLPSRALAAAALVLSLTAVSGTLGPELSGLLAPFPIITSVLAVFTHAVDGNHALERLLRGFLVGFYGFAVFCFVLAITLSPLGVAAGFALAISAALITQAVIFAVRMRFPAVVR